MVGRVHPTAGSQALFERGDRVLLLVGRDDGLEPGPMQGLVGKGGEQPGARPERGVDRRPGDARPIGDVADAELEAPVAEDRLAGSGEDLGARLPG